MESFSKKFHGQNINIYCSSVDSVIFLKWSWQLILSILPWFIVCNCFVVVEEGGQQQLNCAVNSYLQETGRLCRSQAKTGENFALNTALSLLHFPLPEKYWQWSQLLALFSVVSVGQLCLASHEMVIAASIWALTAALWKINISKNCVWYINYSRNYVTWRYD